MENILKDTRLSLDLGTNSIGWSLFKTENSKVIDITKAGTIVFPNGRQPKTGETKASERRIARTKRRRIDWYQSRRNKLKESLVEFGMYPSDISEFENLNPLELRHHALYEKIPLDRLHVILLNLNKKRGFKEGTNLVDDNKGKIQTAVNKMDDILKEKGMRTIGEFLYDIYKNRKQAIKSDLNSQQPSTKQHLVKQEGTSNSYEFRVSRRHTMDEFNLIWETQAGFYGKDVLTDEMRNTLFDIIFKERPRKKPKIGKCTLTEMPRIPVAYPSHQQKILYEVVNSLRITTNGGSDRKLTIEQRDSVIDLLNKQKWNKNPDRMKIKFLAIRKHLKLQDDEYFTYETDYMDGINCDIVRIAMSQPERFGDQWHRFDIKEQNEIIRRILDEDDDVIEWLMVCYSIDKEKAESIANTPLPTGYSRLGEYITSEILQELKNDVNTYSEAVELCGYHHSDLRSDETFDELPYYGISLSRHVVPGTDEPDDIDEIRYGKISNPDVHITLNMLRLLVNDLIRKYGGIPEQIVIETNRELKMSQKQKDEYGKKNKQNRQNNEKLDAELIQMGQKTNIKNRNKLKLWHQQDKHCIYSGQYISEIDLWNGTAEVDHILPYSKTGDDTLANKVLCLYSWNRQKGNNTPYEEWNSNQQVWSGIQARIKDLSANKKWRFSEKAIEKFEKKGDFEARALNCTAYVSRMAKQYLECLYDKSGHIWTVNGSMTGIMRSKLGLNYILSNEGHKNRNDHRHHAVDAIAIGLIDRSLMQKIQRESKYRRSQGLIDAIGGFTEPFNDFYNKAKQVVDDVIVYHKPEHGTIGDQITTSRLHKETRYGIIDDEELSHNVSIRKPLLDLSKKEISQIMDTKLRYLIEEETKDSSSKSEIKKALQNFLTKQKEQKGHFSNVRNIKLQQPLKPRVRITTKSGTYRNGDIHYHEIWQMPDGSRKSMIVNAYEANTGMDMKPHPAAKKLMTLHKRDMVVIEKNGQEMICVIHKMDSRGNLFLAEHNEADVHNRSKNQNDSFRLISVQGKSITDLKLRRFNITSLVSNFQ